MDQDAAGPEYDLSALCEAAAQWLARAGVVPADPRAQGAPDARTVRYYQTIGLLDRPLRYDGRQAIYGRRHLLQVVATKVLQSRGFTLAQIQRSLAGLPTERLEAAVAEEAVEVDPAALADVPLLAAEEGLGRSPDIGLGGELARGRSRPRLASDPMSGDRSRDPAKVDAPPAYAARRLVAAEVAPGVTVTVDPERADPDAVFARISNALSSGGSSS